MATAHSEQKVPGLISAVRKHFHSHHTLAPAFSVGGTVITEWAFITEGINNALALQHAPFCYDCADGL